MNNYIILIFGMMIVTYIPRLLPFVLMSEKELPSKLVKFFEFVPYTALGALIIPGVFTVTPELPVAAILGIIFAFVYSLRRGGVIVPVIGSIIVTLLVLTFGN